MIPAGTWTAAMPDDPLQRTAYVNARLLDPANGLDGSGGVVTDGESIVDTGPNVAAGNLPVDTEVIDCGGLCLAPGLVDIRVKITEHGE